MIRNKTLLYAAGLALTLGVVSCDPMGIDPTSDVFEEQFWENPQLARAYVNRFYLWSPASTGQSHQAEQWSDNCVGNNEADWDAYRQRAFTHREYDELNAVQGVSVPWDESYKLIRAANMGLERIPSVPNLNESEKNQLLGETHMFRALFYADMERYWGGVPYVDRVMTLEDESMLPRVSREALFDKILADVDLAIEYLKKNTNAPVLGYINADIAYGLKSRIALYAACAAEAAQAGTYERIPAATEDEKKLYRFTKEAEHYYRLAYDAGKMLINGKYALEAEYKDLFNSTTKGHLSKESIWPMMFNLNNRGDFNPGAFSGPDGRYYGSTPEFNKNWDFRGGTFPTQDLVDCYYQQDEADGKWKQWWKTKQTQETLRGTMNADGSYEGESKDYGVMYKNRDKRFYATIMYDGSYYASREGELMYLIGTWIDNSRYQYSEKYSALHTGYKYSESLQVPAGRSSANTTTGYYNTKYLLGVFNPDGTINRSQPSISYFMLRYAEVLMNVAEAAYKLRMKPETLGLINMIRQRAGIGDFSEAEAGHDLWTEYKLQRRVEFAFEQPSHRYFDLLRWSEAAGLTTIEELNRVPRGMYIFRKGVESELVGEQGFPAPENDPLYFTPRAEIRPMEYELYEKKFDDAVFYKMPFSETLLRSNQNIVQNPGWRGRSQK